MIGKALRRTTATLVAVALLAPAMASAAPPANDDFANAVELSGDTPEVAGSTLGATAEPGEPNRGGEAQGTSVWYRWVPARSGLVRLSCQSNFETIVTVYTGPSLATLVEVGSDRTGPESTGPDLYLHASPGIEYRIAVDGAVGGGAGGFILELANTSKAPANDDFAHAIPIRYPDAELNGGTTEGAGREPGEPFHGGGPTGSSVWFTWTAANSGTAQVFPCHGAFHPVLDVYTGSSVTSLTSVGAPVAYPEIPTGPPPPGYGELRRCSLGGLGGVSFTAVAGQTYSIAVDGMSGEWGWFNLMVSEPPAPMLPPRPPDTRIRDQVKIGPGTAKILFTAIGGEEAHYRCQLDRKPFRPCWSPKTYSGLSVGRHRFAVFAIDESGLPDPVPAVRHFRILKAGGGR